MQWIEATIETDSKEIDALCDRLGTLGVEGLTIEDEQDFRAFLEENHQYWDYVDESLERQYAGKSCVKFYLTADEPGEAQYAAIQQALDRPITRTVLDDETWANSWQKYYDPIEIGERLVIVPDWIEARPGPRRELRLEPGLAFGTGSHPTTQLCLTLLDRLDLTNKKVLDLGCGSGILGIGALVLGAGSVTGVDVDPLAAQSTRSNAALNQIPAEKLTVYTADVVRDKKTRAKLGGGYQVVLSNIVADVILELAPVIGEFLAPGGCWISSGILDERAAEAEEALRRAGFRVQEHLQQEEWHAFQAAL